MKKLLFTFALLGMISACSDSKPNVEIEVYDRAGLYMKSIEVKVKAIEDDVIVNDIIVNRGNCESLFEKKGFPKQLKFGQSTSVSYGGSCDLTQVDVVTNNGSWTVTY
ncbi:hypothetical protein L2744_18215 [Shewanella profunda]|uniref:hypothetical protein n=1 Tax=Shewanella TaxID=22 RepID=UPI0018E89BB2|nr:MULTISPECIES: hypothetical protein [Shewanella]MCL1091496.1 hypothetical protein [Shewanella profunda]